jgi:hypothetical protein
MPLIYSTLLDKNLEWSELEYSIGKKYLKWEELNLKWENVNLTWDEIFILLEVSQRRRGGSSGYPYRDEYEKNNPWRQIRKDFGEEDTKKVIKLYCKVNGIDYEMVKESKKEIKVSVNEFDRFLNETINVKIDF